MFGLLDLGEGLDLELETFAGGGDREGFAVTLDEELARRLASQECFDDADVQRLQDRVADLLEVGLRVG